MVNSVLTSVHNCDFSLVKYTVFMIRVLKLIKMSQFCLLLYSEIEILNSKIYTFLCF